MPSRTVEKLDGAEPSAFGASADCKEQLPTTSAPVKTNVMPSHWLGLGLGLGLGFGLGLALGLGLGVGLGLGSGLGLGLGLGLI